MTTDKTTSCLILVVLLFGVFTNLVSGQVCSPIGQLCTRTTDCCKGCCEAHTCVDRSFACSTDMVSQVGYASCERLYCPPGQICFLREVCPPENPCPRAPSCRRVDVTIGNYTDWRYYRNTAGSSYGLSFLSLPVFIGQFVAYFNY